MNKIILLLSLFAITGSFGQTAIRSDRPDIIFIRGNVYTGNEKQPRAEAIGVMNGRITFVGSNSNAAKLSPGRIVDLGGRTVVPGLIDAHCHLSGVGFREMTLNLEGTSSLDDFLARVKARVDQTPRGQWVTGRGWIETSWTPQAFPTRQDLDKIAPDHPVYLTRADGHGAVANSAAIRLAGVTKDTADPFGGEIMRDKQTGEPNGMFLDNAQALITRHIPAPTSADHERALLLGVERSVKLGWTGLQVPSSSIRERDLLRRLYAAGKIKLRIELGILGPGDDATRLLEEPLTAGEFDNRFTCRAIKVSFDGALGSKGAALLEKYSDYDTAGFLKWKEEDLLPMFESSLRKGVQIWTHAIGDRANRETLNLYEKTFQRVPPDQRRFADPRWRVEHAQIVSPADIPRFKQLGVIPSMQPSHAIGDLHFAVSRLGLKRLQGAYTWQSFIKSGSIIAGGSDAPVERGEPMIEFYAAVARKDLKGFSGEGWHPEEAVSREQALKMFTIWAAHAVFQENSRGSIEVGKLADFTVLSQDIMKIPEAEILQTACEMTVINGEVVYDATEAYEPIDSVDVKTEVSEVEHELQTEGSTIHWLLPWNALEGSPLVRARTGTGWFGYELKVFSNAPVVLLVNYQRSIPGNRHFDILVNGRLVASEGPEDYFLRDPADPTKTRPIPLSQKAYALPADLTRGRDKVVVRFRARPGSVVSPVSSVSILARPPANTP